MCSRFPAIGKMRNRAVSGHYNNTAAGCRLQRDGEAAIQHPKTWNKRAIFSLGSAGPVDCFVIYSFLPHCRAMERFRYDRSSKWLLEHHGDLILYLGDVRDVEQWRALPAEVVQPRQLPDGLLEVRRKGENHFHPFIIEIETYPDASVSGQLLDDIMLVYQNRRQMPDVLLLVLRPKGSFVVPDRIQVESRADTASFHANWKVVELWKLAAADLLATGEPGLMPWVSLTRIDGPIANVLQECRKVIDRESLSEEHDNLLAVSQVLMGLNYNDPDLLKIFGGAEAMIESPVLQRFVAERLHRAILGCLAKRFTPLPEDLPKLLDQVIDDERLQVLVELAATCATIDEFEQELRR